jgi:hypothetical protein
MKRNKERIIWLSTTILLAVVLLIVLLNSDKFNNDAEIERLQELNERLSIERDYYKKQSQTMCKAINTAIGLIYSYDSSSPVKKWECEKFIV